MSGSRRRRSFIPQLAQAISLAGKGSESGEMVQVAEHVDAGGEPLHRRPLGTDAADERARPLRRIELAGIALRELQLRGQPLESGIDRARRQHAGDEVAATRPVRLLLEPGAVGDPGDQPVTIDADPGAALLFVPRRPERYGCLPEAWRGDREAGYRPKNRYR